MDAVEFEGDPMWVISLLDVDPQPGKQPVRVNLALKRDSVSSVSSAPSPAIHRAKDMEALKKSVEQELEEERKAQAAKNRHKEGR